MEKLSVVLLGASISAEGLWAIAAAIIIVGIVAIAAVVARRLDINRIGRNVGHKKRGDRGSACVARDAGRLERARRSSSVSS